MCDLVFRITFVMDRSKLSFAQYGTSRFKLRHLKMPRNRAVKVSVFFILDCTKCSLKKRPAKGLL